MLLLNNFSDFTLLELIIVISLYPQSFKIKLSINSFTVNAIQMEFPFNNEIYLYILQ